MKWGESFQDEREYLVWFAEQHRAGAAFKNLCRLGMEVAAPALGPLVFMLL